MVRWTRWVIAHRKRVLVCWLAVVVLAATASAGLADLLTNRFVIPGAEAEKGFDLLKDKFHQQGDGYTLVIRPQRGVASATTLRAAQFAADRGAVAARGSAGAVETPRAHAWVTPISQPP